jgi:hypothetical protein
VPQRGCTHVSLICGNPKSIAFYRSIGYRSEERSRAEQVLFGGAGSWGPLSYLKSSMLSARLHPTSGTILSKKLGDAHRRAQK